MGILPVERRVICQISQVLKTGAKLSPPHSLVNKNHIKVTLAIAITHYPRRNKYALKQCVEWSAGLYGLCFLSLFAATPVFYRWRRAWRGCCGGCPGRRPCLRCVACGARGPSLCRASRIRTGPHPGGCGLRAFRPRGFRGDCESKLFSG